MGGIDTPNFDWSARLSPPPVAEAVVAENVLDTAKALVYGDRAKDYGPADDNHGTVSRMFCVWLDMRYPNGFRDLDSFDSCVFNVFQKLSRLAYSLQKDSNRPHRDSLVDGAGYFAVMEKIGLERAEKARKAREKAT